MHSNTSPLTAIPTNIITGFLGVGKTSAILHLLLNKPGQQRWAVLVNEFGEIGVDGSLYQGQHPESSGVYIREVPGGCMCCTAGLPMQVALNQLLERARPDRLLIEPTGLGHPSEVLRILSGEHYREVLAMQKIITLVDARNLGNPRYTGHDTFNQQLAIADLVVGNKLDLYGEADQEQLREYLRAGHNPRAEVRFTRQGILDPGWLEGPAAALETPSSAGGYRPAAANNQPASGGRLLAGEARDEGFRSVGWRYDPSRVFSHGRLYAFLSGLQVERMKGVFVTDRGVFAYNLAYDALTEMPMDESSESLVEIIASEIDPGWEAQLQACLLQSS